MENLLENLNEEQLRAVQHDQGPLLIVAGAGTGKTTVLTRRIAYLINRGKASSDGILALTFTDKAAGEMEERVDQLLPIGYAGLWISTFHSFGERLLNAHGLDIGLPTDAKLLGEFEQYALVKKNLDALKLDYYRPLGNPGKFIQALLKHFSRLKDEDISPAQYLEYAEELRENMDSMLTSINCKKKNSKYDPPAGGLNSKQKLNSNNKNSKQKNIDCNLENSDLFRISKLGFSALTNKGEKINQEIIGQEIKRINEVANAYHVYQQLLLGSNALDFGDLINYTLKLFRERPAVLEKYRQQFKYILLDEFQDTNWAQYELIKLLAAPLNNLAVVGDDDQAIYRWRGASMSNVLQFKQDFKASKEIVLTKNYRNAQEILDLSYDFIRLNDPNRLEYRLNQEKGERKKDKEKTSRTQAVLSKKLVSEKKGKGIIEVIEGEDLQDEMRLVAERIAELKIAGKDSSWNDFAVLVRANDSAKEVCATFESAGVPYIFLASRGLYTKPVIMDTIAYFRLLDNYHEGAAMYRVLKIPVFGFADKEIADLNYAAAKKSWSLYRAVKQLCGRLGPETGERSVRLLALLEKHTALARDRSALEIFLSFLNDSGYLKHLSGLDEAASREAIACLNQFKKRIEKFMAGAGDTGLKPFLEELDMEIDAGGEGAITPDPDAGPEAVKVMTIHAAKGLEFRHVFIIGLVDKRFPTIERKEQIPVPDALVKEILPEGDVHLEEERRLMYVAMTRAEQSLHLSWAGDYGGARRKKPSRFLPELKLTAPDRAVSRAKGAKPDPALARTGGAVRPPAGAHYPKADYFSFSKLTAFINCPYQYRFSYILKVPTKNKHYFSFGKTMHSSLQKIFQLVAGRSASEQSSLFEPASAGLAERLSSIEIGFDEAKALYEESWIDDWYLSAAQKSEYRKKGQEIIREFLRRHNRNWPQTLFLEKSFKNKIAFGNERYTICGTIDRIDLSGGRIKIVDYKTGSPKEKLSFDDKFQLLIYQQAARDVFRQDIRSLAFYYLEDNTEVEFLGTESELEKSREKIIETIAAINQNEFPPRPSVLCKFCDYFDICEHRKS